MEENRDFIWNLVFLGKIIEEYMHKNPRLVVEWTFPDEELGALKLLMGTTEAYSLEKKYLMFYDIEELEPYYLKERVYEMLDAMAKKV